MDQLIAPSTCCDGRVVKALDLKSNGFYPRRFEPYSQRVNRTFDKLEDSLQRNNARCKFESQLSLRKKKLPSFHREVSRSVAFSCCLIKG